MKDPKAFSELLEKIYAAAAAPEAYAGLGREIAALLDAESAVIQHRNLRTGAAALLSVTENFTPKSLIDWSEHYYKTDVWFERGAKLPAGKAFLSRDVISFRDLEKTEAYRDFARFYGLYDLAAAMFRTEESACLVGVHRDRHERRFDETSKQTLDLLLPHIRNSLDLAAKLGGLQALATTAFESLAQLQVGVVLVDETRQVLFANARAEAVLREQDALVVRGGRLTASDPEANRTLGQTIRAMTTTLDACGDGRLTFPRRRTPAPLNLRVAPAPRAALGLPGLRRCAAIFFSPERADVRMSPEALRRRYGLTPAEARLAEALVAGATLARHAEAAGISVETARRHLKSIFAKTGAHRQGELIAMLCADPSMAAP